MCLYRDYIRIMENKMEATTLWSIIMVGYINMYVFSIYIYIYLSHSLSSQYPPQ